MSSHGHSTPFLKISCKSVQPFSCNLADKETKNERNKEIDRKQYPIPQCIGDGVINVFVAYFLLNGEFCDPSVQQRGRRIAG